MKPIGCTSLILALVLWFSVKEARADALSERAEFLIVQNEQAKDAIKSISYDFEAKYETVSGNGKIVASFTGRVAQTGTSRATLLTRSSKYPDNSAQQEEVRSFTSEKSLGFWSIGNPYAYEYQFENPDQMSDPATKLISLRQPHDFLFYAFGVSDTSLRKAYSMHPGKVRWEAEEVKVAEDEKRFLLKQFAPAVTDPRQPFLTFELDPSRGFLIRHVFVLPRKQVGGNDRRRGRAGSRRLGAREDQRKALWRRA